LLLLKWPTVRIYAGLSSILSVCPPSSRKLVILLFKSCHYITKWSQRGQRRKQAETGATDHLWHSGRNTKSSIKMLNWTDPYWLIFAFNNKQVNFSMQCCFELARGTTDTAKAFCVAMMIHLQWFKLNVFWKTEGHVMVYYVARDWKRNGLATHLLLQQQVGTFSNVQKLWYEVSMNCDSSPGVLLHYCFVTVEAGRPYSSTVGGIVSS